MSGNIKKQITEAMKDAEFQTRDRNLTYMTRIFVAGRLTAFKEVLELMDKGGREWKINTN